jgi:hypothetical protein
MAKFRLSFPEGFTEIDSGDWRALQQAGVLRLRTTTDGEYRMHFAEPFADLEVIDGEQLTVLKASRVERALAFFSTK